MSIRKPVLFAGDDAMVRAATALPTRGQTIAAVAYVTRDHLGLSAGDALVVNASDQAVRAGATDPRLLISLVEKGVLVVGDPVLHAKIVVRGQTVMVGSANLSARTGGLHEAIWVSTDAKLRAQTLRWLNGLLRGAALQRTELERLKELFRTDPSQHGKAAGHEPASTSPAAPDPFAIGTVQRLWLWEAVEGGDAAPPDSKRSTSQINPLLTGKEFVLNADLAHTRADDVWIEYHRGWLHPPRRVLRARASDTTKGASWTWTGYRLADRCVRMPKELADSYLDDVRMNGVMVEPIDVETFLSLWR